MPAPIAEVPPPAPRRAPKKPPFALSVIVGIGLALGLFDVVFLPMSPTDEAPIFSPFWDNFITLWLFCLFYFVPLLLVWRGANWARWLMIAASVFGLITYLDPSSEETPLPLIQEIVNWLYVPYYLALIIFLMTPAMRRHFAGRNEVE